MNKAKHPLDPLVDVMATLRGENGCPWDREQDHRSLKAYLIEEAYEVLDAIDSQDDENLVEELGDVLLQVVFHAQIAAEEGRFAIDDVIRAVTRKLIDRHPHVFGDEHAPDAQTVLANWDRMKRAEKAKARGGKAPEPSLMDGIPKGLPSLMYALELQKRAAKVGFDWNDVKGALQKVAEEAEEIADLHEVHDRDRLEEEWGDLLFSLVNVARRLHIDSEAALRRAAGKFADRFRYIEQQAAAKGANLDSLTLAEMDALWNEAKEQERSATGSSGDQGAPPDSAK